MPAAAARASSMHPWCFALGGAQAFACIFPPSPRLLASSLHISSPHLQVISDFGFGPWRKAADDFLATFEPSYALKEKRIGSPGAAGLVHAGCPIAGRP